MKLNFLNWTTSLIQQQFSQQCYTLLGVTHLSLTSTQRTSKFCPRHIQIYNPRVHWGSQFNICIPYRCLDQFSKNLQFSKGGRNQSTVQDTLDLPLTKRQKAWLSVTVTPLLRQIYFPVCLRSALEMTRATPSSIRCSCEPKTVLGFLPCPSF